MSRIVALSLSVAFIGCVAPAVDDTGTDDTGTEAGTYPLAGYVQKGPFSNGSTIVISELDADFAQTGRVFNGNILDDSGAFSLQGVDLITPIARVSAEGYYYDEVAGSVSSAPITLVTYVDLSGTETANINPLGHLESSRVLQLLSEGATFADARAQAHEEVLAIFAYDASEVGAAEDLSIAVDGADNAALLAISVLLQGYRTPGEMSELMSAMQTDIRTDGTLDSTTTGSKLVNAAVLVDQEAVREHLEGRYADLGISATIPEFEARIAEFRLSAPWPFTDHCTFPATGAFGENVLVPDTTAIVSQGSHSFAAHVPVGQALRVRVTGEVSWGTIPGGWMSYDPDGWQITTVPATTSNDYTSTRTGDLDMNFLPNGDSSALIEYFERGFENPVLTKTLTWAPPAE